MYYYPVRQQNLEAECFGGTYKAKIIEPSKKILFFKESQCLYRLTYKTNIRYYSGKTTQGRAFW